LIISAKEKGLITSGGGHIMAAGFSLSEEQIPAFEKFVGEYVKNKLGDEKVAPIVNIDCVMHLSGITENFAESLNLLEPYGTDNPEPLIMLSNVIIGRPQTVGNGHVRCFLTTAMGGSLPAIAFRCTDNEIGHALLEQRGEMYNVVGTVKIDCWQNRKKVQFIIQDIMRV
ncbi:MAG: single-stranded-DNA-specific exonuclease RecJ, partial [Alphaproteobacteria bacterium]|nr:single-stranded-DNA-specific exonuclease RecJ [Alphaproteobacteria bacterium]